MAFFFFLNPTVGLPPSCGIVPRSRSQLHNLLKELTGVELSSNSDLGVDYRADSLDILQLIVDILCEPRWHGHIQCHGGYVSFLIVAEKLQWLTLR